MFNVAKQNKVNCGFVSLHTNKHTCGSGKIDIPSPFLSFCLINLIDLFSLYLNTHTHQTKPIEVNTFLIAFEFLFLAQAILQEDKLFFLSRAFVFRPTIIY